MSSRRLLEWAEASNMPAINLVNLVWRSVLVNAFSRAQTPRSHTSSCSRFNLQLLQFERLPICYLWQNWQMLWKRWIMEADEYVPKHSLWLWYVYIIHIHIYVYLRMMVCECIDMHSYRGERKHLFVKPALSSLQVWHFFNNRPDNKHAFCVLCIVYMLCGTYYILLQRSAHTLFSTHLYPYLNYISFIHFVWMYPTL